MDPLRLEGFSSKRMIECFQILMVNEAFHLLKNVMREPHSRSQWPGSPVKLGGCMNVRSSSFLQW